LANANANYSPKELARKEIEGVMVEDVVENIK
jgi:hypothetical protein